MSLGKARRKFDKPSFSGSLKDGLYDQLLQSLQGPDSLPTGKEFFEVTREWAKNHSGMSLMLNPAWPYRMRRYQALQLLQAFDRSTFLRVHRVLWEVRCMEAEEADAALLPPPDESQLAGEWSQWREALSQTYQLQGLIPPDSLGSGVVGSV